MVEEARGEGLIGLEGLVSELKVLKVVKVSGMGGPPALVAKVGPEGRWRRILGIWSWLLYDD